MDTKEMLNLLVAADPETAVKLLVRVCVREIICAKMPPPELNMAIVSGMTIIAALPKTTPEFQAKRAEREILINEMVDQTLVDLKTKVKLEDSQSVADRLSAKL